MTRTLHSLESFRLIKVKCNLNRRMRKRVPKLVIFFVVKQEVKLSVVTVTTKHGVLVPKTNLN